MEKVTGMDWLMKQIQDLEVTNSKFKEIIEKIRNIEPNIFNEFQHWTPLKLILLNYSLYVCTTIISKIIRSQNYIFKEMYYIDLFAGSGINKIKDSKDDFLIGSPFVSILNFGDHYNSMIFCESNENYCKALNLRLSILKRSNLKLMKGDYKSHLSEIINLINKDKVYSFFFIDPYSMEFQWDSMKEVLKVRSDVIFTFMCSEIYRAVGLANKKGSLGAGLTDFFGDESWKNAKNEEELVEIYKDHILQVRPEAPIRIIKVKSEKFHFCYHLFFITNKTKGDNQWLRAIDKAKEEIEANSDLAVKKALDIIKKRQFQISQF